MTIDEITKRVNALKPVKRRQVQRYIKACNITPLGARQRPQQYPGDAPKRILIHLGLNAAGAVTVSTRVDRPRIVSLRTLQRVRSAARKARAA